MKKINIFREVETVDNEPPGYYDEWYPPVNVYLKSADDIASIMLSGYSGNYDTAMSAISYYLNQNKDIMGEKQQEELKKAIEILQDEIDSLETPEDLELIDLNKEEKIMKEIKLIKSVRIPNSNIILEKGERIKIINKKFKEYNEEDYIDLYDVAEEFGYDMYFNSENDPYISEEISRFFRGIRNYEILDYNINKNSLYINIGAGNSSRGYTIIGFYKKNILRIPNDSKFQKIVLNNIESNYSDQRYIDWIKSHINFKESGRFFDVDTVWADGDPEGLSCIVEFYCEDEDGDLIAKEVEVYITDIRDIIEVLKVNNIKTR